MIDQIYSFDKDTLIKSIPKPDKIPAKEFATSAEELLDRILQMADNVGQTEEHRALNYLAVRVEDIYGDVAGMHAKDFSLTAIEVRPSRLSAPGTRRVLDVIFSYTRRSAPIGFTEKHFVRVDVTEEFPFIRSPGLSYYYDR